MEKEKVKEKEKKKLSIKEIGPARLVMLLMAGILLLILSFPNMLSTKNSTKDSERKNVSERNSNLSAKAEEDGDGYTAQLEERLKKVLSKVEGIGNVEVMITLKSSKEKVILKDNPYTEESMKEVDGEGGNRDSSSIKKEDTTVLVDSGNGESLPYIIQELEPVVEGIVVIAEGGDNLDIKKEIMEAAQVLFNVPAHKVKVMKMNK